MTHEFLPLAPPNDTDSQANERVNHEIMVNTFRLNSKEALSVIKTELEDSAD